MREVVHYDRPGKVKPIVQHFQSGLDPSEDEWHILGNLFNSDRIDWADEAVFFKNEHGAIMALGLICKLHPCVVSYYTAPPYRFKGCGYALLRACISRIAEAYPSVPILIEPTSTTVDNHIAKLPDSLRRCLKVI